MNENDYTPPKVWAWDAENGCKLPLDLAERRSQLQCANNSSLTPDTRDEANE